MNSSYVLIWFDYQQKVDQNGIQSIWIPNIKVRAKTEFPSPRCLKPVLTAYFDSLFSQFSKIMRVLWGPERALSEWQLVERHILTRQTA